MCTFRADRTASTSALHATLGKSCSHYPNGFLSFWIFLTGVLIDLSAVYTPTDTAQEEYGYQFSSRGATIPTFQVLNLWPIANGSNFGNDCGRFSICVRNTN
ncbi:hypothetical protein CPC08DRAFT_319529 [Agrocybe pediades]|nr:hypothetical protein CPC08DRAFT_319529 [Agrocybe pediades]